MSEPFCVKKRIELSQTTGMEVLCESGEKNVISLHAVSPGFQLAQVYSTVGILCSGDFGAQLLGIGGQVERAK
jgi:hypothetical protein